MKFNTVKIFKKKNENPVSLTSHNEFCSLSEYHSDTFHMFSRTKTSSVCEETQTEVKHSLNLSGLCPLHMYVHMYTQTKVCCCFSPHISCICGPCSAGSPQSTTGTSPAETLSGCKLCSTLEPSHPDSQQKVRDKQTKQKQDQDSKCQIRSFQVGDAVWTRNCSYGPKWIDRVHWQGQVTGLSRSRSCSALAK